MLTGICVVYTPSSVALVKTAGVSIDRLLRRAAQHAALHARDRPVTNRRGADCTLALRDGRRER